MLKHHVDWILTEHLMIMTPIFLSSKIFISISFCQQNFFSVAFLISSQKDLSFIKGQTFMAGKDGLIWGSAVLAILVANSFLTASIWPDKYLHLPPIAWIHSFLDCKSSVFNNKKPYFWHIIKVTKIPNQQKSSLSPWYPITVLYPKRHAYMSAEKNHLYLGILNRQSWLQTKSSDMQWKQVKKTLWSSRSHSSTTC